MISKERLIKYECKECQKVTKAPEDKWNAWIRCECGGQAYDVDRVDYNLASWAWNRK